ncbi:MAG: ABC transporter permease [Mariprofundus sp.]|nr:ABC transporter permease [Mariprofundus sp.]
MKILSSGLIHLFFLICLFGLLWFNDVGFSFWVFQIIYYLFALLVLMLGLSWLTSALNVFVKDVGQIVSIFLQFGFWATPIFWNVNQIPEMYRFYFQLNPMHYIVEGYRDAFIFHVPFWEKWEAGLFFWCVNITILLVGVVTFKRLRPHFADVL